MIDFRVGKVSEDRTVRHGPRDHGVPGVGARSSTASPCSVAHPGDGAADRVALLAVAVALVAVGLLAT
jgi:hypothetical protein